MRCTECGYMNEESAMVCIKCGTKLKTGAGNSPKPAPPGHEPPPTPSQGAKTMRGQAPDLPGWDDAAAPSSGRADSIIKCPSCAYYPLRSIPGPGHACPNCGFEGDEAGSGNENTPASEAKTVKLGGLEIGKKKERIVQLKEEGSEEAITLSGDRIEMNRKVLEPGNPSISSTLHAVFSFADGALFLEDKSSNGATFVQVVGKMKVANGSKIVIGNKVYTIEIS